MAECARCGVMQLEITRLRDINDALSVALNKMKTDFAAKLSNKDRDMLEKCKRCTRGIPKQ